MTEVKRTYAVGDIVLSTRVLRAPPQDGWDIGVEFGAGTECRVVDVREYAYVFPYIVEFTGGVEISVKEGDIALATLAENEGVIVDDRPDPVSWEKPRLYQPTRDLPHRACVPLHRIHGVLLGAGFVAGVYQYPAPVLSVTAVILAFSGASVLTRRLLSRAPLVTVASGEPVRVFPARSEAAAILDLLYTVCILGVLIPVFLQVGFAIRADSFILKITIAVFLAMHIVKEVAHDRATYLCTCDE